MVVCTNAPSTLSRRAYIITGGGQEAEGEHGSTPSVERMDDSIPGGDEVAA
jgi:hypothetical protein